MKHNQLEILDPPKLTDGRMVLAFSGWMDGGGVSTETVGWLTEMLDAKKVASIRPEGFYIYNFPGSMEVSALFRPHVSIEDGLIKECQLPENTFYCDPDSDLILFNGKEPNMNWDDFAACILALAAQSGVTTLYFVGSFSGTVPHTRAPRLISTVSDKRLKAALGQFLINFTNYEGPASFSTYLLARARRRGVLMASLVAEIPAYIHGTNPKCIEAMVRTVTAILGIQVGLEELRSQAASWEKRLDVVLKQKTDLAKYILKLEQDYDDEVFDTQMGDLKEWLQQQGIRVD